MVVMNDFVQHDEVDLSSISMFLPTYILGQLCDGVVMLFGISVWHNICNKSCCAMMNHFVFL